VEELRAFKDQHAEQLRRCRTFLDGKLADLAGEVDVEARHARAAVAMQEIQDDVAILRQRMTKRRWPRVTLVGFGGIMGTALSTAATVAAGGFPLAVGLGVGAGVLQLGGAAYAASDLLREPRFNSRAPLAYAALAAGI
jgi:hypothetical protein